MSKTTSPAGHGAMSKQQSSTANFSSSVALDGRFCWGRQITTRCDLHARNTAATILHENFYHTDIDYGFVLGVTSDAISRTCFGRNCSLFGRILRSGHDIMETRTAIIASG